MGRTSTWTTLLVAVAVCSSQAGAASVSGRAVRKNGSNPAGPCRATLRAEVDQRGAPSGDSDWIADSKTTFAVPVNQSGAFRFAAVPNSKYVLTVECATA